MRRAGMLVSDEQGAVTFRHELARQATLDRLPSRSPAVAPRQGRGRNVRSFSAASVAISRRVHHAAGAGNAERVLAWRREAAAEAAGLGAHREAAAHLATALRYVVEAPTELAAQLHEDWAYEAGLSLRIDDSVIEARRRAIALWRELGRDDKVGLNLRWLSRLHWYRGESARG